MNQYLGIDNSAAGTNEANSLILPLPVEFSTSYGKGTLRGPQAIINASPYLEFYDEELDCETWRSGIFTLPPLQNTGKAEELMQSIWKSVDGCLQKNKFVVSLGGEHSISSAIHQAFHQKYPNLSVLQFDAHSDLRDQYEDSRWSHACVMRRIWEQNKNIVCFGIRSQCIEEREFIAENKIPVYYAHQIQKDDLFEKCLADLTEQVYITFDADFLDPAIMPSVGTPEPGGFFWYETLAFLRKVFERKQVVGFDVVELSPVDNLPAPDFLIAKLIYKMIGYKYRAEGRL
jgi:agmatinase